METQLRSFLQSSQDPTAIANKVKGAILAFSFLIIFAAGQVLHITLTANDVLTLATELGSLAGAAWTIYGCILHLVTFWGTIHNQDQ